ncbi:hypothetical protein OU798_02425 [Prolixibacteraceae bacterium Z1-6]|uniref:Uncharacterized protein n=1 Tax=Draconibacterium aestuarii TaxID=2998507 RepID=A0A9X3F2I6_9BACT|nr:hypothetical protein [Prolixibacteraceae bacterium Z1-6]
MSRYEHLKKKNKKGFARKLTSTQKRFLMAVVFGLILFAVQLVMHFKK